MCQRNPLAGNSPLEPKPGKPGAPAELTAGLGRSHLPGPKDWPAAAGIAEAEEHHAAGTTSALDVLAEEQKDGERSQQQHARRRHHYRMLFSGLTPELSRAAKRLRLE